MQSTMNPLFTIHDFTALSLRLNFLLSFRPIDWAAVLACMFDRQLDANVEARLLETLHYLDSAYGGKKRKVGTPAILHPIRAASILARAYGTSVTLDVLTTLLHDKDEDILSRNYSVETWTVLEEKFNSLGGMIEDRDQWFLNERVFFLARKEEETYEEYLLQLIHQAARTPELIAIKLADRLDNTLDLRMDFQYETTDVDIYHLIFRILFDRSFRGLKIYGPHRSTHKISGSGCLYALFKNYCFCSRLQSEEVCLDEPSQWLLRSLVTASINEARNVILHIFTYHLREPEEQRTVVRCVSDLSDDDNTGSDNGAMESFINNIFDHKERSNRKQRLEELYKDKKLMVQAAIVFVVLFSNYSGKSAVLSAQP
jgi:hypothetical protein